MGDIFVSQKLNQKLCMIVQVHICGFRVNGFCHVHLPWPIDVQEVPDRGQGDLAICVFQVMGNFSGLGEHWDSQTWRPGEEMGKVSQEAAGPRASSHPGSIIA